MTGAERRGAGQRSSDGHGIGGDEPPRDAPRGKGGGGTRKESVFTVRKYPNRLIRRM